VSKTDTHKPPVSASKETDKDANSTSSTPILDPDVGPGGHSQSERRAVTAAAFVFALGTFASRILGLIRDRMTAQYFPVEVRDAFIVAFRLPNMFRRLLGEGALSVSMIPVLVELMTKKASSGENSNEHHEAAKRLVGSIFTLLLTITITISLLAIVFMPDIIHVLVSGEGYMSIPGKYELTVKLARVMFSFLILITMYAFFMAILNSLRKFAMAAIAPTMFNIAMISAALWRDVAEPEKVLAWSVILGGFMQMSILIPSIVKAGYWPKLSFMWKIDGHWVPFWQVPEVRRVFRTLAPSLFGLSIVQFSTMISVHFASRLAQGSHFYLYCADRVLELPLSLFAVSVGSAVLPTLSAQWARGDREAMTSTLSHSLRLIAFVALPAAIGMFMLAQPITEVLFLGKEFKYLDVLATSEVIQVYSFGLLFTATTRILVQGFYSMGNTWYPAIVGAITLLVHLLFTWAGTKVFGLKGLAAASIFSSFVSLTMLSVAYSRWVGALGWPMIFGRIGRFLVGGVALAGGCLVYDPIINEFGSRFFSRTFALGISILLGGGLYMGVAAAMDLEEYRETTARVIDKILRKFKNVKRA
jgi:putative peptidoglycan lipid II flippase